jgi:magnesium transporter
MLLESFSQQVQEIDNRVQQLKNSITNSEEYIRIHFDSQRNRLMRINLLVSMATLAVGTGAARMFIVGYSTLICSYAFFQFCDLAATPTQLLLYLV